jgi:hypothetical protein
MRLTLFHGLAESDILGVILYCVSYMHIYDLEVCRHMFDSLFTRCRLYCLQNVLILLV